MTREPGVLRTRIEALPRYYLGSDTRPLAVELDAVLAAVDQADKGDAADRIDKLRTAIDKAVDALNEAWGGFGPSEALEAVIGDLQRARTADDIAQGRDWPPVVLREYEAGR